MATATPIDAAGPADAAAPDGPPRITGLSELASAAKGSPSALFGSTIAVSATELLVGAPLAGSGNVSVYDLASAAKRTARLQAPSRYRAAMAQFGSSIDLDGDTLVVSATEDPQRGRAAGAVYVFERSGGAWTQTAKLVPPEKTYQFGWQLALSGDTVVVAAPWDTGDGQHRGEAFVFERSAGAWKQTAKLVAPVRAKEDLFGYDVAIAGDLIAVGSLAAKGSPKESGAAYVFERGADRSWSLAATLVSEDRAARDTFGNDVAVVGDAVVVSAPANVGGQYAGAVYVFRRGPDGYHQNQKIVPARTQTFDYFGDAIAARGNHVIIGAPGSEQAWLYEDTGTALVVRQHLEGDRGFGYDVAIGPDHVAVTQDNDRSVLVRTYAIER